MNNVALGFDVNLAVHIIFRSGGLSASLLLGWLSGKKYSRTQVLSVIFITVGVASATLSSIAHLLLSPPPPKKKRYFALRGVIPLLSLTALGDYDRRRVTV